MIAQCKSLDFKLFSHLLTLCKKLSYNLQNLLLQPSTLKVAHMTSTSERDPAHARDELEKWHLSNVVRCIILPIVNKGWSRDLVEAWDATPT